MTEDQIERRVERWMDIADAAYMAGLLTEKQYQLRVRAIDRLANRQYRRLAR